MVFISMEQSLNSEMIVVLNAGKLSVYNTEMCAYIHKGSWRTANREMRVQFCIHLI